MNQTTVNMTERKNDHDSFLRLSIEINLASVKGLNLKVSYFEVSLSLKSGGKGVYV